MVQCGFENGVLPGAAVLVGSSSLSNLPYAVMPTAGELVKIRTFKMDGGAITGNGVLTSSSHLLASRDTSQGGALYVVSGAIVVLKGAVNLMNNLVDEGATFYNEDTFALSFGFPTTAGHWLPAADCVVERAQCCVDDCVGLPSTCNIECTRREAYCATAADGSDVWAVGGSSALATPVTAVVPDDADGGAYSSDLSRTCCPRNTFQPCKWQVDAALLGGSHYGSPTRTSEIVMPFICTPGLLGANTTVGQTTAVCGGRCPVGFYCPDEATLTPVPCPSGAICAEGASAAQPCPAGTYADPVRLSTDGYLTSVAQCLISPAGSYCTVGTAVPIPCMAGTFTAGPGRSTCDQ